MVKLSEYNSGILEKAKVEFKGLNIKLEVLKEIDETKMLWKIEIENKTKLAVIMDGIVVYNLKTEMECI